MTQAAAEAGENRRPPAAGAPQTFQPTLIGLGCDFHHRMRIFLVGAANFSRWG